jgi:DNA-binding transcriptional regulator YdaS (Cro superfamily)
MQENALRRAYKAFDESQSAMARALGVTQPTIWHWLNKSKRVPAEFALKVEELTGVSRHDLRPDLYPRDAAA